MRILLIMDPLIRVPPQHYGGIERVVADLANGLTRRGHRVTLWAAPGSRVQGHCVPFGREGEWTRWSNFRNALHLAARFARHRGCFDVIHNFGRLAYLGAVLRSPVGKVQTYMRAVDPRKIRTAVRLRSKRLVFTAVSCAIRRTGIAGGGTWRVVYNCAPAAEFPFSPHVDPATAPLLFLGRLEQCKGADVAIEVARRAGRRLWIAGNVSHLPKEREYFQLRIAPAIDGERVVYVGPVDNEAKRVLLGQAAAVLMPVQFEEPFPVVLAEALLSGTPVIAFRRGGIPEGIEHGKTGFLCDSAEEMAALVSRLPEIDRAACRAEAERRFSDEAVVAEYERIYREVLGG